METLEIGKALVALCNDDKHLEAIETYYSDDIVSIEGAANEGMPQRMEGIEAIKGKNNWWFENHEVHESIAEGPFVAEGSQQFVVRFTIDVTGKADGQRIQMTEVGIYDVADGKIVQEQFLYNMAG